MDWSRIIPKDPATFWAMVAALAVVLPLLAGVIWFFFRAIRRALRLEAENKRLREELESRLRFPQYARDAIALTEMGADRKIEELRANYESALAERDQERARGLEIQLHEIEKLRRDLSRLSNERDELAGQLQSAVVATPPRTDAPNAIGLPSGLILCVRYQGRYGALQPVEQIGEQRALGQQALIRYAWWYQPDGSGVFTTPTAQRGFGEAREGNPASEPVLEIGPMRLYWSTGGPGFGWVYYGPSTVPSPDYELGATNQVDISRVEATRLQYQRGVDTRPPA